ncbi:hypothetical protein B0H11DRAFT_1911552 [Mycena galericulata]|nr:hypothetical protein B0H11DRAFT_1911552 [Mycena galericulata]
MVGALLVVQYFHDTRYWGKWFVKGYGGYGVFVRWRGSSQRSSQIGGVVSVGTKSIKGSGVPSFVVEGVVSASGTSPTTNKQRRSRNTPYLNGFDGERQRSLYFRNASTITFYHYDIDSTRQLLSGLLGQASPANEASHLRGYSDDLQHTDHGRVLLPSGGFGCEVPNKGTFVDAEVVRRVRFVPTATGGVSAWEGVRSSRASYMSVSLDDLSCKGGKHLYTSGRDLNPRKLDAQDNHPASCRTVGFKSQLSSDPCWGKVVSVGTKSIKGSGVPSFAVEALAHPALTAVLNQGLKPTFRHIAGQKSSIWLSRVSRRRTTRYFANERAPWSVLGDKIPQVRASTLKQVFHLNTRLMGGKDTTLVPLLQLKSPKLTLTYLAHELRTPSCIDQQREQHFEDIHNTSPTTELLEPLTP